jgi:hypothetical protein
MASCQRGTSPDPEILLIYVLVMHAERKWGPSVEPHRPDEPDLGHGNLRPSAVAIPKLLLSLILVVIVLWKSWGKASDDRFSFTEWRCAYVLSQVCQSPTPVDP